MRFDAKQPIAGHPAIVVRELLRSASSGLDVGGAARRLGRDRVAAEAALRALVELGYLELDAGGRYQTTVSGNALAGARANTPLLRSTADRLVADLVERAHVVERDTRFLCVVTRLAVFGSYLDETRDRVGDIDLLLDFEPREPDPERRRAAFDAHSAASGRRFAKFLDQLARPERHVKQYLRARSKHLSFHSGADAVAAAAVQRVLYERRRR